MQYTSALFCFLFNLFLLITVTTGDVPNPAQYTLFQTNITSSTFITNVDTVKGRFRYVRSYVDHDILEYHYYFRETEEYYYMVDKKHCYMDKGHSEEDWMNVLQDWSKTMDYIGTTNIDGEKCITYKRTKHYYPYAVNIETLYVAEDDPSHFVQSELCQGPEFHPSERVCTTYQTKLTKGPQSVPDQLFVLPPECQRIKKQ
jgi:hypothetical protein